MVDLIRLFASFSGRINRVQWWAGYLFVLGITLLRSSYFDLRFLDPTNDANRWPSIASAILALIVVVLASALTIKRLNDRDQPRWIGFAWVILIVLFNIGSALGVELRPNQSSGAWLALLIVTSAFAWWVVVDNGFLKGTPGPNRFGPVPLGLGAGPPDAATTTVQQTTTGLLDGSVSEPRNWGAIARNVIVAAYIVVLAAVGFGVTQRVSAGVSSALQFVFVETIARVANAPELKALLDANKARMAKDDETALRHLNRAVELYGSGEGAAMALSERAQVFKSLGRLDEALADAERAVEVNPGSAMSFSVLGDLRDKLGDAAGALAAYEKAVELDGDSVHFYKDVAESRDKLGDDRGALAAYDEAHKLRPDGGFFQLERGLLLEKANRLDEAIDAYGYAVEFSRQVRAEHTRNNKSWLGWLTRRQARALVLRGTLYQNSARDAEALADYDAAIAERPEHMPPYTHRGWLYEMRGEINLARADYERAAELDPDDEWVQNVLETLEQPERRSIARLQRGNRLRTAGKNDQALTQYDEAIRLDPQAARAYVERAWLHYNTGEHELAVADATRALEREPTIIGGHSHRAVARYSLGDWDGALADLNESLRLRPDNGFALTHRGWVHQNQGETTLARADYEAAAAINPFDQWLQSELKRVQ